MINFPNLTTRKVFKWLVLPRSEKIVKRKKPAKICPHLFVIFHSPLTNKSPKRTLNKILFCVTYSKPCCGYYYTPVSRPHSHFLL